MTNITFNHPPTAELSGLQTASSGGKFIVLQWTIPNDIDYFATEIWVSATNNRASATLYAKETSNSFRYPALVDETFYFWIRPVDVYGYSVNNPFHPVSATAGVAGTLLGVGTANLASEAVTKFTRIAGAPFNVPTGSSPQFTGTAQLLTSLIRPSFPTSALQIEPVFELRASPSGTEWPLTGVGTLTGVITVEIKDVLLYAEAQGTVTFTQNSSTITGVGTNFRDLWDSIQYLAPPGFSQSLCIATHPNNFYFIDARPASNTVAVMSTPYAQATTTTTSFYYPNPTSASVVFSSTYIALLYRKLTAGQAPYIVSNPTYALASIPTQAGKIYELYAQVDMNANAAAAHCATVSCAVREWRITEVKR